MARKYPATLTEVPWMREYILATAKALHEHDYCFAGAVAQAFYGYARMTADVDVFVTPEVAYVVLRALRTAGFIVDVMAESTHYAAHLPSWAHLYPEVRVDVLVASSDPEWSAAKLPCEMTFEGAKVHVMPAELLALSRFYSDEPRHKQDLAELLSRQLFDPAAAARIMARMDRDSLHAWKETVRELSTKTQAPRRPLRAR